MSRFTYKTPQAAYYRPSTVVLSNCWSLHFLLAVWLRPSHIQLQHPVRDGPHRSKEAGGCHMGADQEAVATADLLKDRH